MWWFDGRHMRREKGANNERNNKEVLMRDCKRHVAHRVASIRSAVLAGGGGVPLSWLGGSTPVVSNPEVPPPSAGIEVPPPPTWDWDQRPWKEPETGVPPGVNGQTPVKTLPSPSFGCGR